MFFKEISINKQIAIVVSTLVIVPLGVGYVVSSDMLILNTESQWISFWGSYLGALVGALLSAWITLYSVKHADRRNDIHRILTALRECQNTMYKLAKDSDCFERSMAGYVTYVIDEESKDGNKVSPANEKYLEIDVLKMNVREDILVLQSRLKELSFDGFDYKNADSMLMEIYDLTEKNTLLLVDLHIGNTELFGKIQNATCKDAVMVNEVCNILQDAYNEFYIKLNKLNN